MERKKLFSAGLVCMFCCLISLTSCQKGSECTGVVYTYIENELGLQTPIGACNLTIGDESFTGKDVNRIVATDASGRYEGTWAHEAYLPVEAIKRVNDEQYLYGIGYLNLTQGNTIETHIPLELRNY